MAQFQVVAVYPLGRRQPLGEPFGSFLPAEADRFRREQEGAYARYNAESIEVDGYYRGADGCGHVRLGVRGEDLGYSVEEIAAYRWDCEA